MLILAASSLAAQPLGPIRVQVRAERQPLIDTMRELVSIESGSHDAEGLARIADVIGHRLRDLGGEVELVPASDVYQMQDTPDEIGESVLARFRGSGTRRILLLAHMDTVYLRGMLEAQPFRIDGDRAYGLGIAATSTAWPSSSTRCPCSTSWTSTTRSHHGADHRRRGGELAGLAVSPHAAGAGARRRPSPVREAGSSRSSDDRRYCAFKLTVRGRASHAGSAPEQGLNALYELMHQIMQTRDLSDPEIGLKMNWTVMTAGTKRNVIPAEAQATADVRVMMVEDYERIEPRSPATRDQPAHPGHGAGLGLRAAPTTPPGHRRLPTAGRARADGLLRAGVESRRRGGGIGWRHRRAFAALRTDAPVIEGMGLRGFGAHSSNAEYVHLSSIEPRLYLLVRMIMEVGLDRVPGLPRR